MLIYQKWWSDNSPSDNTGFLHKPLILVLYKMYQLQKHLTSLIFNTIVSIGKGSVHLHDPTQQHL